LAEVKRLGLINENILRVLYLKVDPRIVDALVEHARTAPLITPSSEAEERVEVAEKVVVTDINPDEIPAFDEELE
jgi:hypothetical protein